MNFRVRPGSINTGTTTNWPIPAAAILLLHYRFPAPAESCAAWIKGSCVIAINALYSVSVYVVDVARWNFSSFWQPARWLVKTRRAFHWFKLRKNQFQAPWLNGFLSTTATMTTSSVRTPAAKETSPMEKAPRTTLESARIVGMKAVLPQAGTV